MEDRINRLEDKVDRIQEDISDLKIDAAVKSKSLDSLKDSFDAHTSLLEKHVDIDNKILKELNPLFESIPSLVELAGEHRFKKEKRKRNVAALKDIGTKIGIVSTLVTVLLGLVQLFNSF